ncbi:hypothetical protein P9112_000824 [Eukaryota sp. TZLM1-RC]
MDLSTLNFAPQTLEALSNAGFKNSSDLLGVSIIDLIKKTSLDENEALTVVHSIRPFHDSSTTFRGISALELLSTSSPNPVISFIRDLDNLLDGGFPTGTITELIGAPNSGKTQLCLQLTADVYISSCLGGTQGEAVFIDTEGDFCSNRLQQISMAVVEHLVSTVQSNLQSNSQSSDDFDRLMGGISVDSIMQKTIVYRAFDYLELLAIIYSLSELIQKNSNIKLLIIDSIAAPFKYAFGEDYANRTRILHELMTFLRTFAFENNVAVVLTNHLVSKSNQSNDQSINQSVAFAPALGDSFGQHCSTRLLLSICEESKRRKIISIKPNNSQTDDVYFDINNLGVRGST